jgi:urease accessory protein
MGITMTMTMTMTMITGTAIIIPMIEPLALMRLLQLASPMLPVGAYAYSQGLEAAIESGAVHDATTAEAWIADVLDFSLTRFELPLLWRMYDAWNSGGDPAGWNAIFVTGRDTAEARAETLQTGYSLVRLIESLEGFEPVEQLRRHPHPTLPHQGGGLQMHVPPPRWGRLGGGDAGACDTRPALAHLKSIDPVTYPLAYAFVVAAWGIPVEAAVHAYAWAWLENQVAVAMKAIPIGQVAGQRILLAQAARIPDIVAEMATFPDDDISNVLPGMALAGCRHETQYSRLFRS